MESLRLRALLGARGGEDHPPARHRNGQRYSAPEYTAAEAPLPADNERARLQCRSARKTWVEPRKAIVPFRPKKDGGVFLLGEEGSSCGAFASCTISRE